MEYQIAFDSFIGRRKENQDVVLNLRISSDIILVGVADGMGGTTAGKVASSLVMEAITEYIQSLEEHEFDETSLKPILQGCYEVANFYLAEAIEKTPTFKGMGTTLCLLLIYKDKYAWANVGDSRIYSISEDNIQLITRDHTYIGEVIRTEGEMPENLVKQYEHMLTRSVDGQSDEPDLFPESGDFEVLKTGTYFLLCSDGLILNKAKNDFGHLQSVILQQRRVEDAVSLLIKNAFESGSTDNIAVGVVAIKDTADLPEKKTFPLPAKEVPTNTKLLYAMLLVILITAAFLLFHWGSAASRDDNGFSSFEIGQFEYIANDSPLKWQPLNQMDFNLPLGMDSKISWIPYEGLESIDAYVVTIKEEDQIVRTELVSIELGVFTLEGIDFKEIQDYTLSVDAIGASGSEIEGNSIKFWVK